jgi:hypothetical protein
MPGHLGGVLQHTSAAFFNHLDSVFNAVEVYNAIYEPSANLPFSVKAPHSGYDAWWHLPEAIL